MSKVLVIKNVDFSSVAVDHITIEENIPCTDITLSKDSVSFDTYKETDTISVTLTPANTTDIVSWESSNPSVATVDDGVITILGIGTAVITVSCGTVSKTITINQSSLKNNGDLVTVASKYPTRGSETDLRIYLFSDSSWTTCGGEYVSSENELHLENNDTAQTIRVPYGATHVKVEKADSSASNPSGRYVIGDCVNLTGGKATFLRPVNTSLVGGTDVVYGECVILRVESNVSNVGNLVFE